MGAWRHLDDVEFATLEEADWFHDRRMLEPIVNVSPVEFGRASSRSQNAPAGVAGLKEKPPGKPGQWTPYQPPPRALTKATLATMRRLKMSTAPRSMLNCAACEVRTFK